MDDEHDIIIDWMHAHCPNLLCHSELVNGLLQLVDHLLDRQQEHDRTVYEHMIDDAIERTMKRQNERIARVFEN